jgi:hypothetical protein
LEKAWHQHGKRKRKCSVWQHQSQKRQQKEAENQQEGNAAQDEGVDMSTGEPTWLPNCVMLWTSMCGGLLRPR